MSDDANRFPTPELAHHLPAPRELSAEEMAPAPEEARIFRRNLDKATEMMEGLPSFVGVIRSVQTKMGSTVPIGEFLRERAHTAVKRAGASLLGETVVLRDDSRIVVSHVEVNYGRPGWYKVYGRDLNTGEFVSAWDDDIVTVLLRDGTSIRECV